MGSLGLDLDRADGFITERIEQSRNYLASLEEVMGYLMGQVRHTKGDPEAAVTLIEFSDFQ
jgi:hypothetical protein